MRINYYAGPGAGKSVLAAWTFSELKKKNFNVELIPEYIKAWAWLKRIPESWDQWYIFGKQLHTEDRVLRKGAHIITDSPLLMQIAYMMRGNAPFTEECVSACRKFNKEFPSINIFLKRTVPYQTEGRYEDLDQAIEMDNLILSVMQKYLHNFESFDPLDTNGIIAYISKHISERNL